MNKWIFNRDLKKNQIDSWIANSISRGSSFNPLISPFQSILAEFLADLLLVFCQNSSAASPIRILEAGCDTGLTTLSLYTALKPKCVSISLLDFNKLSLQACQRLFQEYSIPIDNMYEIDLLCSIPFSFSSFSKDIQPYSYQLVFNSGLIEHYKFHDRCRIIKSMANLAATNGFIVVVFPDHRNFAYRFLYLTRWLFGIWRYPPEFYLDDLHSEFSSNKLSILRDVTLDFQTVPKMLKKGINQIFYPITSLLLFLSPFKNYLRVIVAINE